MAIILRSDSGSQFKTVLIDYLQHPGFTLRNTHASWQPVLAEGFWLKASRDAGAGAGRWNQ